MRTRKGAARTQANKRLFKRAKGYVGGRRRLLRTVKETLDRAGAFAYRDRRVRKRDFRALWISRINAAVRKEGLTYSVFMNGLKKSGVTLNRKALAELAVSDAAAFSSLLKTVKQAAGK